MLSLVLIIYFNLSLFVIDYSRKSLLILLPIYFDDVCCGCVYWLFFAYFW